MHLRGGPWAGMYLAHFMHLAMVVLTVAAVYGFARRIVRLAQRGDDRIRSGRDRPLAHPARLRRLQRGRPAAVRHAGDGLGVSRGDPTRPRLGRFPVAGLLAGFACGSKLTGVPEVLFAVGGLSALGIVLTGRTSRVHSEEQAEPRIERRTIRAKTIRRSASLRTRLDGNTGSPRPAPRGRRDVLPRGRARLRPVARPQPGLGRQPRVPRSRERARPRPLQRRAGRTLGAGPLAPPGPASRRRPAAAHGGRTSGRTGSTATSCFPSASPRASPHASSRVTAGAGRNVPTFLRTSECRRSY